MTTVNDLIQYIEQHRTGKVFCGWTRDEIAESILNGVHDNSMLFAVDGGGKVVGVVCSTRFSKERVLHIDNILVTSKDAFKQFVSKLRTLYPGWQIEAQRNKKLKHYDTERFITKVMNMKGRV